MKKHFFKILISILLIGYLVHTNDFGTSFRILQDSQLWIFPLCLLISYMSQWLGAYRWKLLATPLGFQAPLADFFRYFMLGNFLSLFLPGSIGGDIGRAVYLGAHCKLPKHKAAIPLLAERINGLMALLLLTGLAGLLNAKSVSPSLLSAVLGMLTLGVLGVLALYCVPMNTIVRRFPKLAVLGQVTVYWRDVRFLLFTLLVSILTHVAMVVIHLCIAAAIGLHVSPTYLIWVYGITGLASALPISFNGIREGAYVVLFRQAGVSATLGMAFAVYWFLVLLVISLLGGLPLLTERAVVNSASEVRELA